MGSEVGNEMPQTLLRRFPAYCSIVPRHDRTLLGWLGVALTGTDAGSNALFGNVQKVTAERLGLAPVLMAATNSSGGVMGKMIDAQSIVVASAPTQQVGREAEIFRAVIKHSLVLAAIVGLIVTAYAFLVPGWVPRIAQP